MALPRAVSASRNVGSVRRETERAPRIRPTALRKRSRNSKNRPLLVILPAVYLFYSFVRLFIHGYIPFGIRNLDDKQPVADSDVS